MFSLLSPDAVCGGEPLARHIDHRDLRLQVSLQHRGRLCHKVLIYKEYHSPCPLVGIGTLPTPLSRQQGCPSPHNRGRGDHSPASEGSRESLFRRLEKKLSTLPTLWSLYTEETSSTLAPLLPRASPAFTS